MRTVDQPTWLCVGCGYAVNQVSNMTGDAAPPEGAVSLCLNCGKPYLLGAGKWRPLTRAERLALPIAARRKLAEIEILRSVAQVSFGDLTKRDPRA